MTDDGDIAVVEGGLDADGRPRPGARELARIPAARPDERRDRPRARRARARPIGAARPAPGAPAAVSDRLPERGMDPGAVLLALLGSAEPRVAHGSSSSSTTRRSARTPSPDPGRGAAVLRVKGTTKALVATTDANQAVGALDPWLGAALTVAEATRNVSITGARPLGVTNCLNYGDPTRPEAFWQLSEGVRGLGDACRALGLPVTGGNVSLYNESPAGPIAPTPEIGVVGLLDDVATLVGPAFRRRRRRDRARRRGDARASPASAYAALAGAARRTARPASTWRARRRSRRSSARRSAAGSSPRPRTSPAAAWRSRSPSARCGAGSGRQVRLALVGSPAVDLFGESPSRLVVSCRPAARAGARAPGPPARAAGRARSGRSAATAWSSSSTGRRADGRRRGARQPRRRRARRPARATSATPGSTAWPARSAGRADPMCGVFGAVLPGGEPTEAASIAALGLFALQHRGQESAGLAVSDGEQLMLYKDLGMISSVLDERRLPSLRGELAIAHCRYSTTGSTVWENAQPTYRLGPRRALAIGHNGNLVNTRELLGAAPGRPRRACRPRPTRSC